MIHDVLDVGGPDHLGEWEGFGTLGRKVEGVHGKRERQDMEGICMQAVGQLFNESCTSE